jgi:hypothetical protein
MPTICSATVRTSRLRAKKLAITACGPHASQPVQSWWPSSQLRNDSPCCSTILARAREFSSMIRTPVGQTSLQTRQPEQ